MSVRGLVASTDITLVGATIARVQAALDAGVTTCEALARESLSRIDRYDRCGPTLRAIITVNPRAIDEARALDRQRAAGGPSPPLFGVPVVVKDNLDVAGLPTTSGSVTLSTIVPARDACVVERLRAAGAVIVAKANMTELAYGGGSVSSLGGQVRNPYDLSRTPGGSSGGTGAAVAASYAVAGLGSDTGQSVRSPASACGLVGLRPTRGLVSRRGLVPFSPTQDEVGPLARTVEDVARLLAVMAAEDPEDPVTARGSGHRPASYLGCLRDCALAGARLGLLAPMMGEDAIHAPVNAIVAEAVERMRAAGAVVVTLAMPELVELTRDVNLMRLEFADALAAYFATLGERAPVRTLAAFLERGECHPGLLAGLAADAAVLDGPRSSEYRRVMARRDRLRAALVEALDAHHLDALVYPHQRRLAVPIGEEQVDRNGVLAHATGLPAVCLPGGWTPPSTAAPVGIPVGIEFLGRDWDEGRLLGLAGGYERQAGGWRPPPCTP